MTTIPIRGVSLFVKVTGKGYPDQDTTQKVPEQELLVDPKHNL